MSRARTILAGSVGNAVEWFDWTIYASFAIFFSSQFFPEGNETTALLASFGIFAVGFFMRPVGGWLLGIFSDRYGRKAALGLTILMMAGGSLIIAVTPTYATIGLAAPLLLTAARLLQGLSLGGEYASATTFLAEMAPSNRRGFYSSFVFFSAAVGILAASAVGWALTSTLTKPEMAAWGWRIPFLLARWAAWPACGSAAPSRRPKPSRTARRPAWKSSRCAPCCASIRWKCCASSASPS